MRVVKHRYPCVQNRVGSKFSTAASSAGTTGINTPSKTRLMEAASLHDAWNGLRQRPTSSEQDEGRTVPHDASNDPGVGDTRQVADESAESDNERGRGLRNRAAWTSCMPAARLTSLAHRVLLRCRRHSLTENRIRLSLRPASFSQSKRSSSASR